MSDLRTAAQQALEALVRASSYYDTYAEIAALEAALAEPPAAWAYKDSGRICDNKDGRLTAPEGWRPLYD